MPTICWPWQRASGAEEAEVFGTNGRSVDVDLRKDQVELASESFHRDWALGRLSVAPSDFPAPVI